MKEVVMNQKIMCCCLAQKQQQQNTSQTFNAGQGIV